MARPSPKMINLYAVRFTHCFDLGEFYLNKIINDEIGEFIKKQSLDEVKETLDVHRYPFREMNII